MRRIVLIAAFGACSNSTPPAAPPPPLVARPAAPPRDQVTVAGWVIDRIDGGPAGEVEVVFRGPTGDLTTKTTAIGTYSLAVRPGTYRAFVRDAAVISIGTADRVRIDIGPGIAGIPDESLMAVVRVTGDLDNVELPVVHAATISGQVVDEQGQPVAHAVVRARSDAGRPVLGTDIAEADDEGNYELRVAPGRHTIDARHPRFAGTPGEITFQVDAGAHITSRISLARGCVISGKVVTASGAPANEGALEMGRGGGFGPAGRIEPDGTFRFAAVIATALEETEVTLRAWPWMSPPSQDRSFACKVGTHVDNVVFKLPEAQPDLSGELVDASGGRVPLGYVDVTPLDPSGIAQQERADAAGHWEIYALPVGRYSITASAPRRGIVSRNITVPARGVKLDLGGTGRIEGTTTALASGSLAIELAGCEGAQAPITIAHEPRIVTVTGGRFTIDDVPACKLSLVAWWRTERVEASIDVTADRPAYLELDVGPPRGKTVHGTVRDAKGHPVASARVTAMYDNRETATASADREGRYALHTYAGASLVAGDGDHVANATVGRANVDDEQVDLVLGR